MSPSKLEHEYKPEDTAHKFYCPFCEKHSDKFLPAGFDIPVLKEKKVIGGGYRLNATCPHCYSTDRERVIYLYLKNKSRLFDKKFKVLHIAPEKNLQKVLMAKPNISYLSADIDSPLAMVKIDITDIRYEDNSFDVVICNHVLEHIQDDRKAMSELRRVLKPGGWAILQVPISLTLNKTYEDPKVTIPEEREREFGQKDHVRIYAKDYRDRLEKSGFSVEVFSFVKEFGEAALRKYGLLKDENIYICLKPGLKEAFKQKHELEKPQIMKSRKNVPKMLVNRGLKTKTLLINPDTPTFYQFGGASGFPLGLGYIAAVLEKNYDVKVIDVGAEGISDNAIKNRITNIKPKIVGITSDTLSFQRAIEIATIVKQVDKKIIIVIGGAHVNALPDYPLKYDCFDISVYGEGERTAVELWDRLDKGKSYADVKGICFRRKDEIVVNPKRELIENLDELLFPARHLFPMDKYRGDDSLTEHPVYAIGTSRGCPYSCAFCSNNIAFGKKYRFRSTKSVVDEIELLINEYKAKGIYFREDLFTANKQRVIDLCGEIEKRGLHFNWECESRVSTLDEELLKTMKNAGCEIIWCGVESGSQRILDLLNKQTTLSQIREVYNLFQKVGIKAGASLILGVPGETIEEIKKTIEFAEELKPKSAWIGFVVFTAFPNSPLYDFVKQNKLYEKEVRHGILVVKTDEFDRATLEEIRQYAIDRVNGTIGKDELMTPEQNEQHLKLLSYLIEGQKVLEIGCGSGSLTIQAAKTCFNIVGIDTGIPAINQATDLARKEKLEDKARFMVMDAANLDFPDNSFDSILIPDVLARYKDSRKILAEAVRVVRNGGRIIVSVPDGLRIPFAGHLRVFFKDTLLAELQQYAEDVIWHELPFKKWLVCSFFVNKKELAITQGPAIDIFMPTYNGRETIGRAIKSVVTQTYRNWNLFVVNDGGEDVRDIIKGFKDERIKYIRTEHKGKSHALNTGIAASGGEYIGYLDDDDMLYPIHFEVLLKAAVEQKKNFVYNDWYEVSLDENNREIGREFTHRQDIARWMFITQNYINHKAILHSRKLLEKADRYDEQLDLLIDWDMIRRLAFISPPYHISEATSEHMMYYRGNIMQNRISSLWTRDQEKARRSMEIIIRKTAELPATKEEIQQAVVHAMLHRSYYHSLDFIHAMKAQTADLEEKLRQKDVRITELESALGNNKVKINSVKSTLGSDSAQIQGLELSIKADESQIAGLEAALGSESLRVNQLEIALNNNDAQISGLESTLKEQDARIESLNAELQKIKGGTAMQLLGKYRRFIDRLLRPGSLRRRVYNLVMKSFRVILKEGWMSFFRKVKGRLTNVVTRTLRYYRRYGFRQTLRRVYRELRPKKITTAVQTARPSTGPEEHVIKFYPHQTPLPTTSKIKRVAFLVGCLEGTSKRYRVFNLIEGLVKRGIDCYTFYDINLEHIDELLHSDIVVLFRAGMWEYTSGTIKKCRDSGIPVVFDVDDLVFEPESVPFVDGIVKWNEEQKADYMKGVKSYRETLLMCDYATGTTPFLAERLRQASGRPAFVIPNTINEAQYRAAEEILKKQSTGKRKGNIIKIGYFSGTYTHNKDFLEAAGAVCEILRRHKNVEFHVVGELDLPEEFNEFSDRIVREGFMPYLDMLKYLSEMDINIAPLELDNPFTMGKSELKIFEAGIVNVPTVASRTDTYKRCVTDGEDGFLAGTEEEWIDKLSQLVENRIPRSRIGATARQNFLQKFYIHNVVDDALKVYEEIKDIHMHKPIDLDHIDIGWVIPEPFIASGGHRNIFRTVKKLIEFGHKLTMYFTGNEDIDTMKRIVNEHFYKIENAKYIKYDGRFRYHDVCFATHWSTVYPMMQHKDKIKYPFYFIQDYEPLFTAMGSEYIMAENTYKMGLTHLTSGPWPAAVLKNKYGVPAESFRFPVDKTLYNMNIRRTKKNKNIIFFAKPEMPRRCFEVGIEALKVVKEQRPDIEIILFGSDRLKELSVPFECAKLGFLPGLTDLSKLYRNADLGIVFSTTNPSLVPYEMMACGLAVADMKLEDSLTNYESEDNVYLLNPMTDIMAQEILDIMKNDVERQTKAANGYQFVQGFPDEEGMVRRIEELIKKRISDGGPV